MNPYKDVEDNSTGHARTHFSYEDVASKLLKDNYFLTALELHTELVESGRELPQLREFFSNPGNFEQHVFKALEFGSMQRTASQGTLDSLDTTRFSEDGGGDRGGSGGDVAVLEFELRKAKETINALRANLTQFADGESGFESCPKDNCSERTLKPHEKRALNFLINEYLLLQDYKLTSITFSDENPDQDFEDWDDVGLIMPRPSGLVSLFCNNKNNITTDDTVTDAGDIGTDTDVQRADCSCQTDDDTVSCIAATEEEWSQELFIQAQEIELLKQKVIALETEKLNYQKLYDAAIVSLNSLTTPVAEGKTLELFLPEEKMTVVQNNMAALEQQSLPSTAAEDHYSSEHSTLSATPEQFEIIDNDKTSKKGSNLSSAVDSLSLLDEAGRDWPDAGQAMWIDSALPNGLKASILAWCCESLSLAPPAQPGAPAAAAEAPDELLAALAAAGRPPTPPALLDLLADTLPRILAHTAAARRGAAAALLAAAAHVHAPRRAPLLRALLSLRRRPAPADTRSLCDATCLLVKWGHGGEVLSAVAELLTSKPPERRVLASQICLAVAPYVSIDLCTSLLLSLVLLMCESGDGEVRSLGLKAVCLICPVAEHKYTQLEGIMFGFLKDPVEAIVKDTVGVFVPVLARTALLAGKFSTDLCKGIQINLTKSVDDKEWKTMILYIQILKSLVLSKLVYVMNTPVVKDGINCDIEVMNDEVIDSEEFFVDAECYVCDNVDVKALFLSMNGLLKEKPEVRWPELTWFCEEIKEVLNLATTSKCLNQSAVYTELLSLFDKCVSVFGATFTRLVLKPILADLVSELELRMERLHEVDADSAAVVGVYLVTVLAAVDEGDMAAFLHKWSVYGCLRALPAAVLALPLRWLAPRRPALARQCLASLRDLVSLSGERRGGGALKVYVAALLAELMNLCELDEDSLETAVLPTIVDLLNDREDVVRAAGARAWGGLAGACVRRRLRAEAACWAALAPLAAGAAAGAGPGAGPLAAGEAARAAEALALLIVPGEQAAAEKATTLLCSLSARAPLCAETLGALTPALQLAAHHCRHLPPLAPALRKLEESLQSTPALSQYRAAVEALLQPPPRALDVSRRVTHMLHAKTNINLPNIFKKK